MNCKICGRIIVLSIEGETLCLSCQDDFESGMAAIDHDESILTRLLREQRIRARMPNHGFKQ